MAKDPIRKHNLSEGNINSLSAIRLTVVLTKTRQLRYYTNIIITNIFHTHKTLHACLLQVVVSSATKCVSLDASPISLSVPSILLLSLGPIDR